MRDKQAFEAFVLEKSRARKQEIQRRRRTMLTTGMSLCICLLVVVCVTAVWKPWQDNGEALTPSVPTPSATPAAIAPGGTSQMNGVPTTTDADLPNSTASPEKTLPQATMPRGEALPLDEAFFQKLSDYAIPDKIEMVGGVEIQSVRSICQVCDWIMQQAPLASVMNGEGDVNGAETYTLRIYYPEKTVTCYLDSKNALFKMADGPWVAIDAANVAAFKGFFDN